MRNGSWIFFFVFSLAFAGNAQGEDLKAKPSILVIHSRTAWGAIAPKGTLFPHKIRQISVHHTATASGPSSETPRRLRGIQKYHQEKKWPDIAYHFLIDKEGEVWALRSTDFRGDTSTSYDPSGHFLPVLEGNFEQSEPTAAQLDALVLLLAWARVAFGVETIQGHRDLAATLCPGEKLYALIESAELARRVSAAGDVVVQLVD